jgi:hypothetical protein
MRAAAQANSAPRPPQGGHAAGPDGGLRPAHSAHSDVGPVNKRRQAGAREHAQSAHDSGGACVERAAWHGHCQLVCDRGRVRSSPRGSARKGAHAWQCFLDHMTARRS